jgi:phage major head subunit gpT-like protein
MLINRENLHKLSAAFKKVFEGAIETYKGDFEKIAMVIPSNSITVNYAWLGEFPKMREWIGDRVLKDLTLHEYTITRKKFELTIEVDADDIKGDNLGIVKPRILTMAQESRAHYDELIFELLEANANCYDGKPFFASDHEIGGVTFSNIGDQPLSSESLNAARAEMRAILGEGGQPLRINPNLLVIPQTLEGTAKKILKAQTNFGGSTNLDYNLVDYVVIPWLTDETAWYLFDTTRPLKPLILQQFEQIKFSAMDKEDDEAVFMRDKFRYGTSAKDNAGYGLWQLAYKSTGDAVASGGGNP